MKNRINLRLKGSFAQLTKKSIKKNNDDKRYLISKQKN